MITKFEVIAITLTRGVHKVIKLLLITSLLTLMVTPSVMLITVAQEGFTYLVRISNEGVVYVYITGKVIEGLNTIQLPIEPDEASIKITINGELKPGILMNNTLYIPSSSKGDVKVVYLAKTQVSNGVFAFNVSSDAEVTLVCDSMVILLSLPKEITDVFYNDSSLVIKFKGLTLIKYIISEVVTTTTPATTTTTTPITTTPTTTSSTTPSVPATVTSPTITTTPPTTTPKTTTPIRTTTPSSPSTRTTPTRPSGPYVPLEQMLLIAVVAVVAIVATVFALVKRSKGPSIEAEIVSGLDDTDKAILKKIKELGGSILQSELQKQLGIPKATLWRHVKRLEKMGFIEVTREGRTNRLTLKKDVPE